MKNTKKKNGAAAKGKGRAALSAQQTIPYLSMHPDGVCKLPGGLYTKTVEYEDINYSVASTEDQTAIFSGWSSFLNYFDSSLPFQLSFINRRSHSRSRYQVNIPKADDNYNSVRDEFTGMLKNQIAKSNNGIERSKYITFGIPAEGIAEARPRLERVEADVMGNFKRLGVPSEPMDGRARLALLHSQMHPGSREAFRFSWKDIPQTGFGTKDFIAPDSLDFHQSRTFRIGQYWGAVSYLQIMASELSDKLLAEILELDAEMTVTMHIQTVDQLKAIKTIKGKISDIGKMKVEEQRKAVRSGYDPDILPPAIKMYITDLEKLLDDLSSKNERLFHISITIRNYARNKKDLGLQLELLKRICQKNNCTLMPCDYLQEDYLSSSLPLGVNRIQVSREMHTSGIAIFVPFTTQELFQVGGTYYGLNTVSGNMIMANRSRLKNPNGLILGTPGSGKSFSVKREILDSFLKTTDDIIICDPEGEYFPLVQHLQGQLVRIASNSDQYINPMDINFEGNMDENPISTKSDFIISLCEIIVGGKYGLTAEERSVIDRCVRAIYMDFLRNQPSREKMPILSDLHQALVREGEIALRVANSLEMYVDGSQNLFNHRTNIDLNNRIICFDIKELGNQLKKVGMLIVQDNVWNRVTLNRAERKVTRYYIDEFHLLLKEEQTAKYSAEIWKRFRKWGGVPTGITQNVKDLLSSAEVENIFDNSDFVYMLNQAAGDRDILAEKLHISPQQMEFVTNSGPGEGLIRYDKVILPFTDNFPTDTVMYSLLTTKPLEQQLK